jgi:hypothetical protein
MSLLVVVWWLAVTEVGRSGGGERERERERELSARGERIYEVC